MKWQVGDWCFCAFELAQVKEARGGKVFEISTGFIRRSTGRDGLEVVPLTLRNIVISANWKHHHDRLHRDGSHFLNFPDIQRWLEETWYLACLLPDPGEGKEDPKLQEAFDNVRAFADKILEGVKQAREIRVDDVRLFR